jgi:hypothetical protein
MMELTETSFGIFKRTELELSSTLKSHKLLISIIFVAQLELDRCGDGFAVGVLAPPIAHDSETQRLINYRSYGLSNCIKLLISSCIIAILNSNKITDITVAAAFTF